IEHPQLLLNVFRINFGRLRNSNETALLESRNREEKLESQVRERTSELNETLYRLQETNKELSQTRDHLIETQNFRQKFLAIMSHEIRTPMNAILGLTNLLLKSELSEQQARYLNVIQKSGSNLLVIINDILDLAKIESGKMELEKVAFPLVSTINSIHTILDIKAKEKGIELFTVIDENTPQYVLGDETRLTQIIINLASNAIKFTEKGHVTVNVKTISDGVTDCKIRFGVKDTGIGIPADKLDKIFENFGQASSDTARKFGGTGLGLSISKQLVELHGATLNVTSEPGKGSDFFFTILYQKAQAPVQASVVAAGDTVDMKSRRILIVDDNEFNQMVAVDSILDLFPDLTIDIASSGKEGLDLHRQNDYDFIFMDVQMPEMDGYEVTRRIRSLPDKLKSSIRICAMTANVTREEVEECTSAGMDDFMIKPFTTEQLREKILNNIKNGKGVKNKNTDTRINAIKEQITERLKLGLPTHLHYHSLSHTLDVLAAAIQLGRSEGVSDAELELLQVAALYHDIGFLEGASNHEATGCSIAIAELPEYGFSRPEIEKICGMIMATQYPQHPKNELEQILCDADLDYLGRDDFFEIGNTLYKELLESGRISSQKEWNNLQVDFLSSHRYFTKTAQSTRANKKEEHLSKIKKLI
ncbi:MAG: ATP-binding protein, partial [Bacteroidota bacterium]